MGVLYSPIPLQIFRDHDALDWLEENGIRSDVFDKASRYPTQREIRHVLDTWPEYKVEYSACGDAEIKDAVKGYDGMSTTLRIIRKDNPQCDEDQPCDFYFSKGWPELNLEILKRLAAICGPFIFIADSSGIPALVEPDTDPETVWRAWYPKEYAKDETDT